MRPSLHGGDRGISRGRRFHFRVLRRSGGAVVGGGGAPSARRTSRSSSTKAAPRRRRPPPPPPQPATPTTTETVAYRAHDGNGISPATSIRTGSRRCGTTSTIPPTVTSAPRACPTTPSRRCCSRRPTTGTRPPPRRTATGSGWKRPTASSRATGAISTAPGRTWSGTSSRRSPISRPTWRTRIASRRRTRRRATPPPLIRRS